jgi:hypothetical protein
MPITAVFFLIIYFGGCIATLFKKPIYGLYLYFFCFYVHPPGKYWGYYLPELRWSFIIALLTALSMLIHSKGKMKWITIPQGKLLLLFFLYACLQYFFALNADLHLEWIILLFKMLILFIIIVTVVENKKDLSMVIIVNLLGCAYMGWLAYSSHTGGRFESVGAPALSGANLMAMHVAAVLVSGAFLLIGMVKNTKYLLIIPVLLSLNLIFLTQSRGGLLGIICAGIFIFLFRSKEMKKELNMYALLAILACSALVGKDLVDRINTTQSESADGGMEKSAYSRIVIIESQIAMASDRLSFGYGHRGTLILSPAYVSAEYLTNPDGAGARRASHNLTMSILVDHGLIGLIIYYLMIFYCLKNVVLLKNEVGENKLERAMLLGLLAGLVGFIVSSQFSSSKVLELDIWFMGLIAVIQLKLLKPNLGMKKVC